MTDGEDFKAFMKAHLEVVVVRDVKPTTEVRQKMSQKITVILVQTGKEPRAVDIDRGLESFQQAIGGGYVQCVPLGDPWGAVDLWCDEDGISKSLPRNRYVTEIHQWVHGDFFLTGGADDDGEAIGVPAKKIKSLLERFAEWAEVRSSYPYAE